MKPLTKYNILQKRDRIMRELRAAHTSLLWGMNIDTPQGKRAVTLAAKRLMERSRDLYRLVAQ